MGENETKEEAESCGGQRSRSENIWNEAPTARGKKRERERDLPRRLMVQQRNFRGAICEAESSESYENAAGLALYNHPLVFFFFFLRPLPSEIVQCLVVGRCVLTPC